MRIWLLVAAGGALGAVLRYAVYARAAELGLASWWATLAVNVAGSVAVGVVLGASPSDSVRLFVATGVLGGFTTFSTFSHDAWGLARGGFPSLALAYAGGSVVAGVLGVWAGRTLVGAG